MSRRTRDRIELVQFFVQLRRTGNRQRHKKGEQNANPNASTRLHLPPRFHRGELARKKFLPEFESDRPSRNPAKTWIGGKTIRQLTEAGNLIIASQFCPAPNPSEEK